MNVHKEIVWIASWPKSGNTWVRCFLDAYFMGEVDINEILASITDNNSMWYQIGDGSKINDLPIEIQSLTRGMALLRMVRNYNHTDKPIPMFVKSHTACMQVNGTELIPAVLTKASIFIVRDPRDVLPSFANHIGIDLDKALECMCDKYRRLVSDEEITVEDFISSWHGHAKSWMDTDAHNVLTVRYEDMKGNPVETFSGILKHAGVEVDVEKVRRALEVVELDKLQAQEREKGFCEASKKAKNPFFNKGATGGWDLTPRQLHLIEKRFGSIMKRLGYIEKRKAA